VKSWIRLLIALAIALPAFAISASAGADAYPSRDWYVGKILFKSDRGGGEALYAMNPDGSDVQQLTDPNAGFYYQQALQQDTTTADGRYKLYVTTFGGDIQIWQQDTVTLATSYVVGGTPGADYDPAWAPDSRWVAYVSQQDGHDEIHVFDRQTHEDRRLTVTTWEWNKHPSYSPDGSQIVFYSNRVAGWKHVWLMNADGSQVHNISGWDKSNDWDPVWVKRPLAEPTQQELQPLLPAGTTVPGATPALADYVGKILFKSDREGTPAFYLLDPATGNVVRDDDPNVGFYYTEASQRDMTSPDGRYRLFVKQNHGYEIWQEDMVTQAQEFVVGLRPESRSGPGFHFALPGVNYDPAWSSDTRYVAYVTEADGNDEIHLFDRVTKQDKRLTYNTYEWDKHPSWSPDGKQIVFWSNRVSGYKHLWIMGADGSNQTNLSGWGQYNDWDPIWIKYAPSPAPQLTLAPVPTPGPVATPTIHSPDWYVGKILFKSDRAGNEALYAMNADGSGVEQLTDPNAGFYYVQALQQDSTSADGRYKLYVTKVGDDIQIWQQDTVTGQVGYVVGGTRGPDYDPAWAPDNRFVAYVSEQDGHDEVHLLDRKSGTDTRLTVTNWEWNKHPSFSPDGSQIAFYSNRESGFSHIWLMNADGSMQHNISGWATANDWDPVWVKVAPTPLK